ncbi:EAL domain-containing protein [Thalassomonas sp. RHCl1]|uniref:EAL domain-containing protein n=1 Tax=Thalassomonas sp. RHCl1 TaxID=2995320 RepID=UPI00248B4A83|nr:EAL domain-containing protein [Thalassomonas sp. RHCl1]
MNKASVLIVDDRPENLIALEATLESLDCDIIQASSGEAALELSLDLDIAIILLDVQMPGMDGYETAEMFRSIKRTRNIPIIFVTAICKAQQHMFKGYAAGGVDFLFKPIEEEVLLSKVKVFLAMDAQKQQLKQQSSLLDGQLRELKQRKAELSLERYRLEKAQEVAGVGSWDLIDRENKAGFTAQCYRVLGLTDSENTQLSSLLSQVDQEARTVIDNSIRSFQQGEPAFWDIEHKITTQDGNEKTIRHHGEDFIDEETRTRHLIATVQDITELRGAQQQLMIANTILENATEGMVITNEQGTIEWVNRAFCELMGYAAEELLNGPIKILRSERHDAAFYRDMWETLLEEKSWQGEIWNRNKSGQALLFMSTIALVEGNQNEGTQYLAIYNDITDLKAEGSLTNYLPNHDALTRLPDHYLLEDRLVQTCHYAANFSKQVALIYLDIESFSYINQEFGFPFGDTVLQKIAKRIDSAIGYQTSLYRVCNDEFAFIVPFSDTGREFIFYINMIREKLTRPLHIDKHSLSLNLKVGVSVYPRDSKSPVDLIERARDALRHNEKEARSSFCFYNEDINKQIKDSLLLESDIRNALEKKEFFLTYQPKLNMATAEIEGVEALIRWQHPEHGIVSPINFIPAAEASGLILPLSEWVLDEACRQAKLWHTQGYKITTAVNISAGHFNNGKLLEDIDKTLKKYNLPAECLEIEITENMMMQNMDVIIPMLKALKARKVCISIDDFGTGYSSFAYLKSLPVDTLKIDRSFIKDLHHHKDDIHIVQAITNMAHKMGLKVVAEGVEEQEHCQQLCSIGCDVVQGYYISRPEKADNIQGLLDVAYISHLSI